MSEDFVFKLGSIDWRGVVIVALLLVVPLAVLAFVPKVTGHASGYLVGSVVAVVCLGLLGGILWHVLGARASIGEGHLEVGAGLYRRSIPLADLQLDQARIDPQDLSLTLRTNGIGMPGFSLGWFRVSDGNRAFVAVVGDGSRVWIPLRDRSWVVVSAEPVAEFIRALEHGRRGRPQGAGASAPTNPSEERRARSFDR